MVYKKAEKSKKKLFLARIVNVLVLINRKMLAIMAGWRGEIKKKHWLKRPVKNFTGKKPRPLLPVK